ncbi:carboxylesterase family protein [Pseudomonas cavernae]|uniref:Carboxylic ester hydrolase n=1 Tax=Pseudomonas cavernae TaxID=2320867 RepID=A0A385Z9P1_9PSED|nr:carboxylesterase family protein [Pseudomonas cavernae]AYC34478.1 carboxylesterase family protein [Pseudomonas cavernae]
MQKLLGTNLPRWLCAGLAGLSLSAAMAGAVQAGPQVQTADGWVEGALVNDTRLFINIPYAQPPVGALRWKAPQPAGPWSGVLPAVGTDKVCAQGGSDISQDMGEEDCLVVRVTTPPNATAASNLPVLVWIHGGAFMEGSARHYDATQLAKQSVVVVSVNYRLGAFGFLALEALRNESADHSVGNYGLQDQVQALRWVQKNAKAFGGNPGNVTIAGQSAGAMSVLMHLTNPQTSGLYQRAIAESPIFMGEGGVVPSLTTAIDKGNRFAANLGCTAGAGQQLDCLRGKPASQVQAASRMAWSALSLSTSTMLPFAPVVDGVVLPDYPAANLMKGNFQRVPVIIGTNQAEAKPMFAVAQFVTGHRMTSDEYNQVLQNMAPSVTWVALRALYPVIAYGTPAGAGSALLSDSTFSCPANTLRKSMYRRTTVYGYEFADPNSPSGMGADLLGPAGTPDVLGSGHTDELPFLFNRHTALGTSVTLNAAQQAMSGQMVRYWTNFIKSGNPNGSGLPSWKPFDANGNWLGLERQGLMKLRPGDVGMTYDSLVVKDFNDDHHCDYWDTVTPFVPVVM